MIEISVKMLPLGRRDDEHEIGKVTVINTADHGNRPEFGNYKIEFKNASGGLLRGCRVENHRRSAGMWPLMKQALITAFPEESQEL